MIPSIEHRSNRTLEHPPMHGKRMSERIPFIVMLEGLQVCSRGMFKPLSKWIVTLVIPLTSGLHARLVLVPRVTIDDVIPCYPHIPCGNFTKLWKMAHVFHD